jgi:hypothetical protein
MGSISRRQSVCSDKAEHTQTHTPVVFGDSNRSTSYTSALDPGQSSSPALAILYGSASASSIDHITRGLESISSAATSAPCEIRVRVEIMGSQTYRKRRGISASVDCERSHYLHPHPYVARNRQSVGCGRRSRRSCAIDNTGGGGGQHLQVSKAAVALSRTKLV